MTESPPKTIQEVIFRIVKGDYDFISKLVFEGNIITYFTTMELMEYAENPSSTFLGNILRTLILNKYDYTGDFERGTITDGYFSIHYPSDNLEDLDDFDDLDHLDDDTYFNNIADYISRFNKIFDSIKETNEDIFFMWVLNLLKTAQPVDIANLISSGFLYEIINEKPKDVVSVLENCQLLVLKRIIRAFDYIREEEHFLESEKEDLIDYFYVLASSFTRKLVNRINSLYERDRPKIREYLELYGWHNADFDPDNYKKMDDWLE